MNNFTSSPFNPDNTAAYEQWRACKLDALRNTTLEAIEFKEPGSISVDEHLRLATQVSAFNTTLFKLPSDPAISSHTLKQLGTQVGLQQLDGNLYADENNISELRVIDKGRRGEYIPYTNRPLGWHTDGYYNPPQRTIRAFILYCINDAGTGGDNQLLDPELAYLYLRDQGNHLTTALMRPDTFTIPATIESGETVRAEQKNPVFQIDPDSGHLIMRYTQRKTHVQWRQDEDTQQALSLLGDLLDNNSDHILSVRLNPGEGLICNNVLHNRSAFSDDPEQPRIMLRARYYDRFR